MLTLLGIYLLYLSSALIVYVAIISRHCAEQSFAHGTIPTGEEEEDKTRLKGNEEPATEDRCLSHNQLVLGSLA